MRPVGDGAKRPVMSVSMLRSYEKYHKHKNGAPKIRTPFNKCVNLFPGQELHHAAHARGSAHRHFGLILLLVTDDTFSSKEHTCD